MDGVVDRFDVQQWMQKNPRDVIQRARLVDGAISKPAMMGTGWSKVGGEFFYQDYSMLQQIKIPEPPLDLDEGLEGYMRQYPAQESSVPCSVEVLVRQALGAAQSSGGGGGCGGDLKEEPFANVDIVTFRNNLNKILGTVVDSREEWAMDAFWMKRTVFLDMVQLRHEDPPSKASLWGRQFEARCTGRDVAETTNEYGILVKTRFGDSMRVLMGAEIDGVEMPNQVPPLPRAEYFRELKTYKAPTHPGQVVTLHRYKYPKWWIQSYLAGVPVVICGERDDHGVVHRLHRKRLNDLVAQTTKYGIQWSPQQIIAFGTDVLTWIHRISSSLPEVRMRLRYDAKERVITCSKVDHDSNHHRHCGHWGPCPTTDLDPLKRVLEGQGR